VAGIALEASRRPPRVATASGRGLIFCDNRDAGSPFSGEESYAF
jgi:hypothetical protein